MPLTGKSAFVTGGSKGIGRPISIGLARAGAMVALTGRSPANDPARYWTVALIEAEGGRATFLIFSMHNCTIYTVLPDGSIEPWLVAW